MQKKSNQLCKLEVSVTRCKMIVLDNNILNLTANLFYFLYIEKFQSW